MGDQIRHYADNRIDVSYDTRRCIHAEECIDGLPDVFDITRRPWILTSGASPDAIAEVIKRCPSGALRFKRLDGGQEEIAPAQTVIVPLPSGPLQVLGRVEIRAKDGSLITDDPRMTLCRCGLSRNKPFCDNSHFASSFDEPAASIDSDDQGQTDAASAQPRYRTGAG